MATTLDAATADMKQSHIAVVSSDSEDDGTTPGSSAFAGTLKTGLYPLLLVMPVCTFLVVSTFNDNEIRRRLYSSPARLVSLEAQQMLTCGTFGLLVMCCVYRGDIPVDSAGRSVLYRPECRERRLVVRVADGLHAYGDRLRIPVGVIRFHEMATNGFRQCVRSAGQFHFRYGVPRGYEARSLTQPENCCLDGGSAHR